VTDPTRGSPVGEHRGHADRLAVVIVDQLPAAATLRFGAELRSRSVRVGGVEQGHARVQRSSHGVGQLLARLDARLVECHQNQADSAHRNAPDRVITDLACLHDPNLYRVGPRHLSGT
jgi:hypothetical protein